MDPQQKRPTYATLTKIYNDYFSLGFLNTDINTKFALISLICYVVNSAKKKKPDVTFYQIVYQLSEGLDLPEDFIRGLAIVCNDFAYGCKEFPTFEIAPKNMVGEIRKILKTFIPF